MTLADEAICGQLKDLLNMVRVGMGVGPPTPCQCGGVVSLVGSTP